MSWRRWWWMPVAGVLVIAAVILVATGVFSPGARPTASATAPPSPRPDYHTPSAQQIAALPEAQYSAVIAGLLPYQVPSVPHGLHEYSLVSDTAVYGGQSGTPIARLDAKNFLQQPTVVDVVTIQNGWALVLTPARQELPSAAHSDAAAQTAGWIRASQLTGRHDLPDQIVVSVSKQTLTITSPDSKPVTYPVGVGAPHTPTPTGVTGYIEARYLDPTQDESVYPIQLTSLHSSAQDEPYGGTDGGLIGVHYNPDRDGAVSHGCVRLPVDAIVAVDALPLGTPIIITH